MKNENIYPPGYPEYLKKFKPMMPNDYRYPSAEDIITIAKHFKNQRKIRDYFTSELSDKEMNERAEAEVWESIQKYVESHNYSKYQTDATVFVFLRELALGKVLDINSQEALTRLIMEPFTSNDPKDCPR